MARATIQSGAAKSSAINSRIHLFLFTIILLVITTMGVLQYRHSKNSFTKAQQTAFQRQTALFDEEIGHITNYIERMHTLMKKSLDSPVDTLFAKELLKKASLHTTFYKDKRFHVFNTPATLQGFTTDGTIAGSDTLPLTNPAYANQLKAALTLLPAQIAMHHHNSHITLSYFITNSGNFTQIYPSIPIVSLCSNYPSFMEFQKDAYSVYSEVAPPEKNPSRSLFWTTPYIDRAGSGLMVTCGKPTSENGIYSGVIGADVVLNYLHTFTRSTQELPGQLFLVTNRGTIISGNGKAYSIEKELAPLSSEVPITPKELQSNQTTRTSKQSYYIRPLQHAPWSLVYVLTDDITQKAVQKELLIPFISILLLFLILPLAYFVIRNQLIIPAISQEKELERLNNELDNKVTQRTKELINREENLRITLNSIGDGVIVVDIEGRVTRMNPIAEELTGWPYERIKERKLIHIFNLVDSQTKKAITLPIDAILSGNETFEMASSTTLISQIGERRNLAISSAPIKNNNDEIIGAILVLRDISDEYAMQKKLQTLRNYLQSIVDSMPSLIIGVNINGKVTQWNRTAEEQTNISAKEAKGEKLATLLPQLTTVLPQVEKSITSLQTYSEIGTDLFKSHTILNYELTIYPLIADGMQGAVIRIDDISEKAALEEQLQQSRKMDAIGQLSGGIAHDFNNMLSGILGSAEMLQLELQGEDAELNEHVDIIMQAALQAGELSRKLLTFGRKAKTEKLPVNLVDIIEECHTILRRTLDRKITINITEQAHISTVIGDKASLQSIFINLAINASHAMPDGGTLTFDIENRLLSPDECNKSHFSLLPGTYLNITVQDTGKGIPKKYLDKIFEPFFTTKEVGKGTGLGLSAVYGTILDHHGAISVQSKENEGTTFTIQLPSVDQKADNSSTDSKLQQGSGTILLVDDEELIQITTSKALEKMGYTVLIANDGNEAVTIFKEQHHLIDLVLMDMIMPEVNGREAFKKMQEIDPTCKVVLSSGFTRNESLTDLHESGLLGFLPKPYRSSDLSDLLKKVLH